MLQQDSIKDSQPPTPVLSGQANVSPDQFRTTKSDGSASLPRPINVCLLISSLEFGGGERQVIELAGALDRSIVDPIIISLSDRVPLIEKNAEVRKLLHIVPKRWRFDFTTVFRVARLLRQLKIDVIHASLFDSEIVARLAAPMTGVKVVIASELNADYVRPRLHQIAQKLTMPLFDVMVANSHAGARFNMRTLGLDQSRLRVVHQGVDTARFRPDAEAGLNFRERIGIPLDAPVVGMVGSFKRQKDHATFLRMAKKVVEEVPNCRFLIAGDVISGSLDSKDYAEEIRSLAKTLDSGKWCHFIGNQEDIQGFYNACDLTALLSLREGLPNVVLESMACGVPVIASNIADNAIIIRDGETGYVVPTAGDLPAAGHVCNLLGNPDQLRKMGQAARHHVCAEFTPERAARKFEEIYTSLYAAKDNSISQL